MTEIQSSEKLKGKELNVVGIKRAWTLLHEPTKICVLLRGDRVKTVQYRHKLSTESELGIHDCTM